MNNRIYADPGQSLYLTRWLEFTLAAFHTNSSTRLNLMQLSEIIIFTKKYGHLKKMIYTILQETCRRTNKEERLVGHVPIELSRIKLFHTFFKRVKRTKRK